MSKLCEEVFENGIKIFQYDDAYKFTLDAIELAKFCNIKSKDRVLDLCAGCGVVGLYSYSIKPFKNLFFCEIQQKMCNLIEKNIKNNNLEEKCKIFCKDLKNLTTNDILKKVDVIICNPPYFKVNSSPINTEEEIAISRHEIKIDFEQIVCKVKELLKEGGKFYFCQISSRLQECLTLLSKYGFEAKKIKFLSNKSESYLFLCESVKTSKSGIKVFV